VLLDHEATPTCSSRERTAGQHHAVRRTTPSTTVQWNGTPECRRQTWHRRRDPHPRLGPDQVEARARAQESTVNVPAQTFPHRRRDAGSKTRMASQKCRDLHVFATRNRKINRTVDGCRATYLYGGRHGRRPMP
jgi:hypothetical protein